MSQSKWPRRLAAIKRIILTQQAGRDGFWLARWLRACDIDANVSHASNVAISSEHRREGLSKVILTCKVGDLHKVLDLKASFNDDFPVEMADLEVLIIALHNQMNNSKVSSFLNGCVTCPLYSCH